ncbi:MAG: hypothetical protein ALECFALPRED_003962 [Alectoria fallacina]|uniref:Uncharacterized protein n=1 Tax=Alectoria fallacina TaxID=1903189 RepID=A0A8H3FS79_9LECA|nr:MAG: hypothetical protein ALECFALPRED_003962 [Alectoria fallacina]
MSAASAYSTDFGTLGLKAYLSISNIPSISTEWSALFPLVSHLANHGEEHQMVGELALAGHLTVGLFPKLGYLDGLRRLLQGGPDFLDRANANSESTHRAWDVNWGSIFTRANGSAISIITDYALRKHHQATQMPEKTVAQPGHPPGAAPAANASPLVQSKVGMKSCFRRPQELHIVRMSRINHTRTIRGTLLLLILSRTGKIAYHFILIGLVVLLCFLGAYGSAAIVVNGLVSKLVCRFLCVKRPSGYLMSNDNHDACMLSAVHENAQTWYLYMGDRGVIDWLLNKTMLAIPSASRLQMTYFRLAHVLQLLAMTFVAAPKGVDGVCLVVLLVVSYGFQYLFGGHKMARQWLEAEKVSVDAHTFTFSGRTPMIGAIHTLSQARDAGWMETLIAPCPRINVWLDELKCSADMRSRLDLDLQRLSSSDRSWVLLNTQLTVETTRLIRCKLSQGKATESLYVKESS